LRSSSPDHHIDYYFSTRELVTLAVLAALGGLLSTYVGYLGNLVNRMLGVPFGAGQFMAGLHVYWLVIGYALVRKPGYASLLGLFKGVVEMLTGSTHGAVIVVVSLLQGIVFDGLMLPLVTKKKELLAWIFLAAGISAASNVLVFQFLYLQAVPSFLILAMIALAFSSGIIFGGYFGWSTYETLVGENRIRGLSDRGQLLNVNKLMALLFVLLFVCGAVVYQIWIQEDPDRGYVEVNGLVDNPYHYSQEDFSSYLVIVNAELDGSYTHVEAKNYSGVPVHVILSQAGWEEQAKEVEFVASDGYAAPILLSKLDGNDDIIVILEEGKYRLVAKDMHGSYWVDGLVEIRVVD